MSFWLNKTNIKQVLSSRLFYKAFAGFWLTIVCIFLLLVLFTRLQGELLDNDPLHGRHLDSLNHLKRNIVRLVENKNRTLQEAVDHPRLSRHSMILLVHDNVDKTVSTENNDRNLNLSLLNDLGDQNTPSQIRTERYIAYGPLDISLNQDAYRLYQIRQLPRPMLFHSIRMLPAWMKLLAVFIPSVILSVFLTIYLITPLNTLSRSARRLAQGELNVRAPTDSQRKDEVGQLIHDFNFMADKLTHSIQAHKQLLADVSHELRTPLTRLNLANAMAQDTASDATQSYLARIEKESQCLDKMLADVLTLSRLEYTDHSLTIEPISLSSLLQELLLNAKFEAQQHNKTLSNNAIPDLELSCDAILLTSAIENITRNAIKYANTHIDFDIAQNAESLIICIKDDGQGVDDSALAELGNAFYRTDSARARQTGGIGLGLAIAKRALIAHYGDIQFTNHQPHGLTVTITLPL
ncbi:ATP-binding protein [Pseudoalteromonas phenolica]|uniref:ATP-binding protein n=1 Tax=Pseudoalteromonas phenolica TaxID=161398 RepID=UPI00110A6EC9|nr:ATP-binding protein [Pseudoalteromonas phenolica]TMO55077.1 two-component sensor histidine kinase [Pseudoalteromonas phenolica]